MARGFSSTWKALVHRVRTSHYPMYETRDREFAPFGRPAVAQLAKQLDHSDVRVAIAAGLSLADLVEHADAIVPLVARTLTHAHPWIAELSAWIIRELGEPALRPLMDLYASAPSRPLAEAFAFLGPRAIPAIEMLDDEQPEIITAITGPWPGDIEAPLPYLGETVRMDSDGPGDRDGYGLDLWRDAVEWQMRMAEGDPEAPPPKRIGWCPDQVAIALPEVVIGAYEWESGETAKATITADNGAYFTNQELLWKALDASHRIAPCNDRIFEGLRWESNLYYVRSGS